MVRHDRERMQAPPVGVDGPTKPVQPFRPVFVVSDHRAAFVAPGDLVVHLKVEVFDTRASYAFGMDMGNAIKGLSEQVDLDLDVTALLRGIEDVLRSGKTRLTNAEAKAAKVACVERNEARRRALGVVARKEGTAFLEANKSKEGVFVTKSGLQYVVLREGEGPIPTDNDTIRVRLRGMKIDGSVFANSESGGDSVPLVVAKSIRGLGEAVRLMHVGGRSRLFIPPELAYGEAGRGKLVPPHTTLVYEIELIAIEPPKENHSPARPEETTGLGNGPDSGKSTADLQKEAGQSTTAVGKEGPRQP